MGGGRGGVGGGGGGSGGGGPRLFTAADREKAAREAARHNKFHDGSTAYHGLPDDDDDDDDADAEEGGRGAAGMAAGMGYSDLDESLSLPPAPEPGADAEEARDALAAETAAREAGLIAAAQETETELRRDLTQRTAELDAAMDTIGALRREIEALRGAA